MNNGISPLPAFSEAEACASHPEPNSTLDFEPIKLAPRVGGWSPDRQRAFIEELATCGVVREAAARVGMTEQSAYRLRRRPDAAGFNRAWEAAVGLGTDRVHSAAFERALAGTVRRRYFRGKMVGEETVFDNRLLIYLLGRLDRQARLRGLDGRDARPSRPTPEAPEDVEAIGDADIARGAHRRDSYFARLKNEI